MFSKSGDCPFIVSFILLHRLAVQCIDYVVEAKVCVGCKLKEELKLTTHQENSLFPFDSNVFWRGFSPSLWFSPKT